MTSFKQFLLEARTVTLDIRDTRDTYIKDIAKGSKIKTLIHSNLEDINSDINYWKEKGVIIKNIENDSEN